MCKFIGVEILAANALIDILESEKGRTITFSKLNKYLLLYSLNFLYFLGSYILK